tara:strand:- start:105 stop:1766 length:1662 start_codon:yes stop_codon:yes gene_type:complete
MSTLTDYKDYSATSQQKQTVLQSLEAGFFPFIPFSFQYSLKLQDKVLLAADLKKRDNFQNFTGRYDIEAEPPSDSLARTMRQSTTVGINKEGSEFGRRLGAVVTESGSTVSRKTTAPERYTGEIASEALAIDIIEQLKKNDSYFGGDMTKVQGDVDKELLKFNTQFLDKNPQTKESREVLDFYLQALNKYAKISTKGILGIEESVGLYKNITKNVGLLEGNETKEAVFKIFKKGLKEESRDINKILNQQPNTLYLTARKDIPADTEHNKFARQILSRFHEMDVYNRHEGLQGDRYLYTAPLGNPSRKGGYEMGQRSRYLGLYTIMPDNVGGKMGAKFIALDVIEMTGDTFATLDNFVLQQQGVQSGMLAAVDFTKIENISQQIANERALHLLEGDSLGMQASNLNSSIADSGVVGAVAVARVMSTREITANILQSFDKYSEGKQTEVAKIVADMVKASNKMSKTWKRATANALDYESDNRYDWKSTMGMGSDDGVWQEGMQSPWMGDSGTGLSISPYLAQDRFLSKDYPSMFAKREVPSFIRKQKRKKRVFRK